MNEENKKSSDKEFLSFYRNSNFSLALEREALDKLAALDIQSSINSFSLLIERIANKKGNDLKQSILFLFDIISKVNYQFFKYTGNQKRYNANRALIIQSFASVEKKEDLKQVASLLLTDVIRAFDVGCKSSNPVVEKAKSYIEDNYQKKISLSTIAEIINVSKNYLCTLFKKECGLTITQYIHMVRMNKSEFLLRATNSTISEIAFQVGYQTYRDFYRNFKKYKKASPKSYKIRLPRARVDSNLP